MKIKTVQIDSLKSDPNNARKHTTANLDSIRASLEKFGQIEPLIVDKDHVIRSGNGRWQVLKELGHKNVDVIQIDLQGSDAIAYAIAANRTAELAEWDDEQLLKQLKSIIDNDGELFAATGFTQEDMDRLHADINSGIVESESSAEAMGENIAKYESSAIRQIVLVFSLAEYMRVIDAFGKYCDQHGLSNNTEAVMHLLETNGYACAGRDAS
jgi:ParB-like chromosome segregation protein Spo0J